MEALPHTLFQVTLATGQTVVRHIRIVTGDRVKVELSPYALTRDRITYRLRQEAA